MAIFLFFGADAYSRQEKINFWKREFDKKYGGDLNINIFEGARTSANEIFGAATSMPFLSEKRLTIVKDFLSADFDKNDDSENDEKRLMAELLPKIPDFCTLVFSESETPDKRGVLYKKLAKTAQLTEFPLMVGTKLLSWIENKVQKKGGTIERDAIEYLAALTNGDLFLIENEIAKLAGYAKNRPITKADIELLTNTSLTTSIFKLTDGISQKNKKHSIKTLHDLIDSGEELFGILHMIMRQFRIITQIKDCADQGMRQGEITSKLKLHPFVVSNTINQVHNFSLDQLKKAFELLVDMDFRLKSGGIKVLAGDNREFVLALDLLIIKLCE